jgi:hypothetical protein
VKRRCGVGVHRRYSREERRRSEASGRSDGEVDGTRQIILEAADSEKLGKRGACGDNH